MAARHLLLASAFGDSRARTRWSLAQATKSCNVVQKVKAGADPAKLVCSPNVWPARLCSKDDPESGWKYKVSAGGDAAVVTKEGLASVGLPPSSPPIGGIVGGSLAAIVIIAGLVAATIWYRKTRHANADTNLEAGKKTQRGRATVTAYANPGFVNNRKASGGNAAPTADANNTYDMGVPGIKTKRTKKGGSATVDANNTYDMGVPGVKTKRTKKGGSATADGNNTYDMGVPGVKTKRTKKQGRSATMSGGSRSTPANNVYDVGVRQGRSASTSNGGGSARASMYDHIGLAGSNGGQASSTYAELDESMYAHTSHRGGNSVDTDEPQLYNTLSRGKEPTVAKNPAQTTTKKKKKKKKKAKTDTIPTKAAAPFDDADAAAEVGQRSNNVYDVGVRSKKKGAETELTFGGFGGEYETIAPPPAHNNVYDVGVPTTKSSKAASAVRIFDAGSGSDSNEIDC